VNNVAVPRLGERTSGILLHPTSLPGPHGSGDLGQESRAFADWLRSADQRYWQMLPVGPPGYGSSPYSAQSAFAGSPLLIALEPLVAEGFLRRGELDEAARLPSARVDYAAASRFRMRCLRVAYESARTSPRARAAIDRFREESRAWLDDFSLFRALKSAHRDVEWTRWEPQYRDRIPGALDKARRDLAADIDFEDFTQWLFADQWRALRAYCTDLGVALIGDIPIFVAHDSADVWQHKDLFRLDETGLPTVVAGVPPDYFSTTGQRWGNPLYRWARMEKSGYAWWIDRLRTTLARFDVVRLDHFIGFQRYWEIPASEATAVNGRWMKGPGARFFRAARRALGDIPLIAEDLGAITPRVKDLRDRFSFPGIKILQFAFGTDPSAPDFLPHNYEHRAVVYTGTHDNDTTVGWFHEKGGGASTRSPEQTEKERKATLAYLGTDDARDVHWKMIRMAMLSVAETAIFPLGDVLGLGAEGRVNRPGTSSGNWEWRFPHGALTSALAARLSMLTRTYGRAYDHENDGKNDDEVRAP
jgi:4-alpha-glucanotransferase